MEEGGTGRDVELGGEEGVDELLVYAVDQGLVGEDFIGTFFGGLGLGGEFCLRQEDVQSLPVWEPFSSDEIHHIEVIDQLLLLIKIPLDLFGCH